MNPIVHFDPETLAKCHALADRRHANKLREKATDLKYSQKLSSQDLHRIGILGEYAVAKILEIPIDTQIHDGSDGGSDLEFKGASIQVKTFTYTGANREVYTTEPPTTLILISCRLLSPNEVEVEGWITSEDFKALAKRKDYGYGERLSASIADLRPIASLRGMGQT